MAIPSVPTSRDALKTRCVTSKYLDARAIYRAPVTDLVNFGPPCDDISLVVVKLEA